MLISHPLRLRASVWHRVSRPVSRLLAPAALALLLTSCATPPQDAATRARDPWEGYNRSMTQFNDAVDKAVLKPVATAYTQVVPSPVRTGVSNFFGNVSDAWSFVNNALEGDVQGALYSFWRVAVNTTLGLGGVLDPASEMRLYRHRKDFGLTLGRWGVPPGPYLVLPILGPSTLRDTVALPVDTWGNLTNHIHDVPVRNSLFVLHAVDTRAQLLGATNLLDQAALDPYSFTRDAWLQKRRNDVYDGNPPPETGAADGAGDADAAPQDTTRYDLPESSESAAPASSASAPAPAASAESAPETPQAPASSASAAAPAVDAASTAASAALPAASAPQP